MAQLAAGNHPLLPDDLPRGQCFLASLPDGRIRINHADARILISAEILDAVNGAGPRTAWPDLAACATYDGALLKINGANRTVIYRIGEYVPHVHAYIGEWPD